MPQGVNPPPRRGRPARSADDVATMRAKVGAAAARLFREEGYAAVSMRRLASEAGCTPMTLYAYFASKADILSHLWDAVYAALFESLAAEAAAATEPQDRLERISRRYVRFWIDRPETYRLVFMTEGVSQPEVDAFLGASGTVTRFRLFFDAMHVALGSCDEGALKLRTETLISGLQGVAHSHITISGYPWSPAEAMVDEIVRALTRR